MLSYYIIHSYIIIKYNMYCMHNTETRHFVMVKINVVYGCILYYIVT